MVVLFKGRVIFRQYIIKKHKHFGIKIYKQCNSAGYTRHESVLGEGQTTNDTVFDSNSCHSDRIDEKDRRMWHNLYVDNFFSSSEFFNDFTKKN